MTTRVTLYLVVEPGRGADCEEELAAVGVGPRVGHAQRVGAVVAQPRVQLVLELAAPDGLATGADPGRVARLEIHMRVDSLKIRLEIALWVA